MANIARLKACADAAGKATPGTFDMTQIGNSECGCMLGHYFSSDVKASKLFWDSPSSKGVIALSKLFRISQADVNKIFYACKHPYDKKYHVGRLRRYIRQLEAKKCK